MVRTPKVTQQTIEKMQGFINNPYSAEFPGIEPNQAGD